MASVIGRGIQRQIQISEEACKSTENAQFSDNYPFLQKFLAEKRKSQNNHQTGSITIFVEMQGYKLCLNDRPLQRSTFVSGPRLGVAFGIADRGLENGQLDWRSTGWKQQKAR